MTTKNWLTLIIVISVLLMVGGVIVGPNVFLGVIMIVTGFAVAWNALMFLWILGLDWND